MCCVGGCLGGKGIFACQFNCNVEPFLALATPTPIPSKRSSISQLLHIHMVSFLCSTVKVQNTEYKLLLYFVFYKSLYFEDLERERHIAGSNITF